MASYWEDTVHMGGVILFFFYGSILFSVGAFAWKAAEAIRMPLHLRWEYYTDGSVFESVDWWTRPPPGGAAKARSLLWDILFLKKYFRYRRTFWFALYPFHLGIYGLILWHAWLFTVSLTAGSGKAAAAGLIFGHGATALAFFGGLGVLFLRVADRELRLYSSPLRYAKWVFMLLTLAGGFYAVHAHFGNNVGAVMKYVNMEITLSDMAHKLHPAFAPAAHVLMVSLWLACLPFGHMARLAFGAYHMLRFDDVPNTAGSEIERQATALLSEPLDWSAPHIHSGKSWQENAASLPGDGRN